MRRVIVIGAGGSGKSTLSRELSGVTGLPLAHLDALYWRPGWIETPEVEWRATIERLVAAPEWIMDGNYGGTLDGRLAACDTVLFLDMSPWRCLYRVLARRLRYAGGPRPELAQGCNERLDFEFLWWIASYRGRRRPRILERLAAAEAAGKTAHVLRNPADVRQFLLESAHASGTRTS